MHENPTRVEAFSDGVFAIAITLLILEIRVPHGEGNLWGGLLALWPSYIAFLLSFVVILIEWVNHHELLRMVRAVNYPFLFANGFLLLTVTFVPFPTAVVAANLNTPDARTAVALYCGTFVANALLWNLLFATIVRGALHALARLRRPDVCLALAGDGPLVDETNRLAARLGVTGQVRFLGFRKDVPALGQGLCRHAAARRARHGRRSIHVRARLRGFAGRRTRGVGPQRCA